MKSPIQNLIRRHLRLLAFLTLVVLSLIAYANALPNSFHFDDFEGIGENASLRDLRNIPSYFFTDPVIFRLIALAGATIARDLDWRDEITL